jgi:DMSO/TMAO reductase YedYZ molybdopterin-dependent catalytic subunit
MRAAGRLPPGQSLTLKWPVLHVGSVPLFNPRAWDFRVFGLVEEQLRLSWEDLSNLPQSEVFADMHCVNALEPVRQPLGRVARHRIDEASEVAARGAACDGPWREQLHGKPANLGLSASDDDFRPAA